MNHSDQRPPSPELLFKTLNAYQESAALKAGIELNLFTAIANGNTTPAAIAQACQASERGARILCDYLVVIGFLTKQEGSYGLTPDSAVFLNQQSPAYMGGCIDFLLAPQITENFGDLTAVVRKGGTALSEDGTVSDENPVWVKFARAMVPMMAMPAQLLANLVNGDATRPIKVLDIAAGHGMYGIAFAQKNPNAQIVGLDWASVLEVAKEHAQQFGVDDRYQSIAGSAFEVDWGGDYDVVLLPNFLHHFDPAANEDLLRKAYQALKPDGRVAILEFVPNEDRISPPIPAAFSLMMLGGTARGDAYTYEELENMCRNAGFVRTEAHPLPASPQTAILAYKV